MPVKPQNHTIEDVRIIFRNFVGEETPYNREGARNFGIILPEELIPTLLDEGWNVKQLKPRDDEGDDPPYYLKVNLSYNGRPPRVVIVGHGGRQTNLTEATVETLDWMDIVSADIIIRPYEWQTAIGSGVAAYVQTLYVTIQEDELELKYREAVDEPQDG